MKKFKKSTVAVLALVLAVVIASGSVLAMAATGVWEPAVWQAASGTPEYEKPDLNTVAGEGVEPEPMTPSAESISTDKPWYTYITYDTEAVGEYVSTNDSSKTKYVYYDPYDYNYGMVMEIKDTNVATTGTDKEGNISIPCEFSSANEVSVTWSTGANYTVEHSGEVSLDIMNGWEIEFTNTFLGEITLHGGYTHTKSYGTEQGVELSQTFSAVHFNSNGVPYQWKVVNYEVMMPIKVEVYKTDAEGEFVLESTDYMIIPTASGACREYIMNGVTYIEDWRTGDGVPLDDFWDDFMTVDKLKSAYNDKLLPKS